MTAINPVKKQLLEDMCVLYWEYDVKPDFSDTDNFEPNSPEALLLGVYDSLKNEVIASYPWRSAIKYITIKPEMPQNSTDGKYKYQASVPDDFLKEEGFWYDSERWRPAKKQVDIIGRTAKTNLQEFTMSYQAKDIPEDELDSWVIEHLKVYIAAKAADIAGLSLDRKNNLLQLSELSFQTNSNIDYKMSTQMDEEINQTLNQFVIC